MEEMLMRTRLTYLAASLSAALICFSPMPSFAAQYTLKIALVTSDTSPDAIGARMLKSRIEAETKGDVQVQIFANASLGGEIQLIQQLQAGTIQASVFTEHSIGNVVPQSRLLLLPFTIKSREVANKIYDSDFARDHIWKALEKHNILYNGMWCTGFRGFHTSKVLVRTPADVKGLKMRVSEAPQFVKVMQALGVNPTPISWSEIYSALSQKVVDGTDTTQYYSWTQKLYEVVPNITVLGQQTISVGLFWNKAWLDSLPPVTRKIVTDAAWDVASWQRQYMAAADAFYDDNLRAHGAKVYYPTKEEIAQFAALTKDVSKSFYDTYGKADVDGFLALVEKVEQEVEAEKKSHPIIRRY
jgi:tripartite ATP-independent transporter DctP family solute receptor